MTLTQLAMQRTPVPTGFDLVGSLDRHPFGGGHLGMAVLRSRATGIDVAWDGGAIRSLPSDYRARLALGEQVD